MCVAAAASSGVLSAVYGGRRDLPLVLHNVVHGLAAILYWLSFIIPGASV